MSSIALASIHGNTIEATKQAIVKSMNLADCSLGADIGNVVIKPNMCYYWDYSTGQTTDPRFVAALIELLHEQVSPSTSISIVESDASAMKCKHVFRFLGYEKLASEYGVKLVNLTADKFDPITTKVGDQIFNLAVPHTIRNADFRINVSKIKYALVGIELTCALKNIFGCNPNPKKFKLHNRLGEAIVAVNKIMPFDLHLVDADTVSGIRPLRLGLVMAGKDPVAIDSAAARIAGLNPDRINYLRLAQKEKVGMRYYISKGVPLEYFRDRYPRKSARVKLMERAYTAAARTGLLKKLGLD